MVKKLYLLLFAIVLIGVVSAQPPFQESTTSGVEIIYPKYEVVPYGQSFNLHTHTYNSTSGLPINNSLIGCYLHLYNSSGDHSLESQMSPDSNNIDFELMIDGNNFTSFGLHSYILWCNSTTVGGYASGVFDVELNGETYDTGQSLLLSIFYVLLIILMATSIYFAIKIKGGNMVDSDGELMKINYMKYLKMGFIGLSYIMVLWVVYLGWGISDRMIGIPMLGDIFEFFFRLLWIAGFVFFPAFIIYIAVKYVNEKKLQEYLDKGLGGMKV